MLQQVVVAPGKLEFREVSNPKINQDQVLVRIKRIGICGSDLRVYEGSYPGVEYPITQGREASGEIVEVGSAVLNLFPGQKVTIQPQLPCGECRYCREGKYNLCENLRVMGFQTPGMASEYFAVDADKVATLPKDSSYEAGTMVEPLAVAVHAVKRAGNVKHKNVLILGAGPIGVITAQAAKGMGAGAVMITDLMDPRLGLAEKCGVDYCVNPEKEDLGEALKTHFGTDHADIIYDCAGTEATIGQAIRYASAGSRIILVGVYKGWANVNLAALADKELKLYTTLMYRNEDYLDAIGLIDEKKVDLDAMVTGHFPFRQYEEAYHCLKENRESMLKVMIEVGN